MNMLARFVAIGAAVIASTFGTSALAESGANFFSDKTVNFIVGTGPGGVYDTNGRLLAEYMQKYLPGSTFVVRNMPGAGGIIAANFVYASKPDGLTIGIFNPGLIYSQLGQEPTIKFDLAKMSWIGNLTSDPRVVVTTTQSGITSWNQLATGEKVKFAACGIGCSRMLETTMLTNALELPIQVVTGYNGNDDVLAMRRGEVQGLIGSRSAFQQFVQEGHGQMIAQIGGTQTDLPQLSSLTEDKAGLRTISLIESLGTISRPSAGPPAIPTDRLAALWDAYAKATSDPEFLARAERLQLDVNVQVGDEVTLAMTKALNQPLEMVQLIKDTTNQ